MPISLDSGVRTEGGVALVSVRVRNSEPVARRVVVENRLPGSVFPPRRHGVPEPGWSSDGYAGVVDAHGELVLGYACRVDGDGATSEDEKPPRDAPDASDGPNPPNACRTEEPVELVDVSDPSTGEADPLSDALAGLADHRPPPDAVGPAGGQPDPGGAEAEASTAGESGPDGSSPDGSTPDTPTPRESRSAPATPPPGVARYLEEVDGRISRAETLESGSVSEATAELKGGVAPVGLEELVALDARALARIADRAESLAARAEAVDVPTDALERLA
ncbi:hypothetical protein GRX01_10400 [Halobaculum sp. WSA2]|uniref:DUF8080 domain-containing protein n=1 Tax=Halobaculum saliterrae TaxID=2073113 RepID=A0A6B0SS47_9EURY|nr:hypothetical protein [Halobaculum saliterrae]MXR41744.1 hypothetical protein [Halobaculum saliterrae]